MCRELCRNSLNSVTHPMIHIGADAAEMSGIVKVGSISLSEFDILNSSLRAYDVGEVVVMAFRYSYQSGTLIELVAVEYLAIIMACGKRAQLSSVTYCEKEQMLCFFI